MSRIEKILKNTLGKEADPEPAQSRVEELLCELNALIKSGGGGGGVTADTLYTGTSLSDEYDEHWNVGVPITLAHPITDYRYVVFCCISKVYGNSYYGSQVVFPEALTEYPNSIGVHDDAVYTWYTFDNASTISGRNGTAEYYISRIIGVR